MTLIFLSSESDAEQQNRNDSRTEHGFDPKTDFLSQNPKSLISQTLPVVVFLPQALSLLSPWPSQSRALPELLLRPRTSAVAAGAGGPRGAQDGLPGPCCYHSNPLPCPWTPGAPWQPRGLGKDPDNLLRMEPRPGTRCWLKWEFVPKINLTQPSNLCDIPGGAGWDVLGAVSASEKCPGVTCGAGSCQISLFPKPFGKDGFLHDIMVMYSLSCRKQRFWRGWR